MNGKVFKKVGVFDSGVGGLTVLRSLMEAFPDANYIYLGDTARVPYGIRSRDTIRRFALECCSFLEMQNAEIIIVACNSASAAALDYLQSKLSVPVVGVIEPGVEFLREILKDKKGAVGIIGTSATVKSGSYQAFVRRDLPGTKIYSKACPLFVPLAEEGILDHQITRETVKFYLEELKGVVDAVVLGCTHYPLLKREIQRFLGPDVLLVESGPALVKYLKRRNIAFRGDGNRIFFVTDDAERFSELSSLFLGVRVETVEQLDVSFLERLLKKNS